MRFVAHVLGQLQVKQAVLADSAGYPCIAQSVPLGFQLARLPALAPLMRNVLPRRVIESSVRNVYGDPSRVTPALVDRYDELTLREGNREALVQRFREVQREDVSAQIGQVRQPTLILWGAKDHLIPPAQAERFRRDIAGSQVQVFEGLGHVPHEEDSAHGGRCAGLPGAALRRALRPARRCA